MTTQFCEELILAGEKLALASYPTIPVDHPRIVPMERPPAMHRKRTDPIHEQDQIWYSTACWRQYIGTWQIEDGNLYLIGIKGRFALTGGAPLLADWFTGLLCVPRGAVRDSPGDFKQVLRIEVENGRVVRTHVLDNRRKPRA